MRLKLYKQSVAYASQLQRRSTEKFVSRIDPEAFSASGSRVIFPVTCHLRFKATATKRDELEEIPMKIPRGLLRSVSIVATMGIQIFRKLLSILKRVFLLS